MPIIPVRNIAKGGVITDVDPYNLPIGSWSWGCNVRFRNQSITRAPVFRTAFTGFANTAPRFLTSNTPASALDTVFAGFLNGRVTSIINGAETDVSVAGFINNNADVPFTSCHLGDVFYINRGDRAPWSMKTTDTQFHTLANWAPVSGPWTANILRASNGALCAYGITQNGTSFPTMVITSEFAQDDAVPATWDYTLGTNNATQNILADMEGAITDACALGEVMVIYGLRETWTQVLDGSAEIWSYHKLFADQGAISTNCVVEVDKKHYVFGLDDIWMHDGNSKVSICDQRTREFIFNGLNVSMASRCKVLHNRNLKEIYFQYVSNDAFTIAGGFPVVDGCNRQAVYHYPTNTWTFDDLPYIFGATMASLSVFQTWNTIPGTWDTIGGAWGNQSDSTKKAFLMIGDVNATASLTQSLYGFDLQGPGSILSFNVDTNATKGWTLARDGIDLDDIGADLTGYKLISSIYPQGRIEPIGLPITFQFGSADYFTSNVGLSPPQTWDANTLYKLDYNAAGRYLSVTITHNDYHWVVLTGLDMDLDVLGER